MIVVADTSPLNYLGLLNELEILPAIYTTVLIPSEVHEELQRSRTPAAVRAWALTLPQWCQVVPSVHATDVTLLGLDEGERASIQLATSMGIDTLLADDADARRAAEARGIIVSGTVGILERAAKLGLLDFRSTLARLEQSNFRLSEKLREYFLKRNP